MATGELSNGVKINPMPPSTGKKVEVCYNGKLAQNSDSLILNVGYGDPNNFFATEKITMQRKGNEFQGNFTVKYSDKINMYFEDPKGRRDDNNGQYYQTMVDTENMSYA